jgi:acyl carrier protein
MSNPRKDVACGPVVTYKHATIMSFNVEIPFGVYRAYVGEQPPVDTFTELREVIRRVFDEPLLPVTREMIPQDVEAWDSVMHVTLLLEVEVIFRTRFSIPEMAYLKSVGDLVDLIDSKRRAGGSGVMATFTEGATGQQEHLHP